MKLTGNLSTFFAPGIKGFFPEERQYIESNFPDAYASEGGIFTHDGLRTNYYVHRAKNEKRVIIGFSGANAQFPLNIEEINYLRDNGTTMICMALPRLTPEFMQRAEKLMRAFLMEKKSPVNDPANQDAPVFLTVHSSSGPILLKLFGEKETGARLRERFSAVAGIAPIFDVPFASRAYSPTVFGRQPLREIFESFADKYPDTPLSQLWPVKTYLKLTAQNEAITRKLDKVSITLGDVRRIQNYAWDVSDKFRPEHTQGVSWLMIAGDKDPFTCWQTTRDIASRIGIDDADFHLVKNGGHDAPKGHPELLDMMMNKADEAAALKAQTKAVFTYVPFRPKQEEELIAPPPLLFRDRAGAALKRGASFLNPAAGLR